MKEIDTKKFRFLVCGLAFGLISGTTPQKPETSLCLWYDKPADSSIPDNELTQKTQVAQVSSGNMVIIPQPVQITEKEGYFKLSGKTVVYGPMSELIKLVVAEDCSQTIASSAVYKNKNVIQLELVPAKNSNPEGYEIQVTGNIIRIIAGAEVGLFHGIQTFRQIVQQSLTLKDVVLIQQVHIVDYPRFSFRGLMLDPARHFIPVPDVKRYIDEMARYKFNALQLHLTDDQGWRMEIKKYPRLTEIGAVRDPKGSMNGPDNGYYTQEQLKEIILFAKERFVEVIPEIDIPGHTVAVLAAYPELGCSHTDTIPKIMGRTTNLMLCASKDKVYEIFRDIIHEVATVFPSDKIHLGGDEAVVERNWGRCQHCQSLKKELGYEKTSDLMNYFFGKMLAFVRGNNRKAILWCELDNIAMPANNFLFPYPKDVILVTWRNGLTPKCTELTAQSGNSLIMAPGEYTYFDYPQYKNDFPEFNNWGMPLTTLEKVYEFDPGYDYPKEKQTHIQGVMATLWGEAIKDIDRAFYMTYPRALALSEAGWSPERSKNKERFKKGLEIQLPQLMRSGANFRVPFEMYLK